MQLLDKKQTFVRDALLDITMYFGQIYKCSKNVFPLYSYNHIFDINVTVVLLEDQGLPEEVFLNKKKKKN